ncbi:MAG: hypothetical protein ACP6IS_03900 [Candidatus Asgardarchaeia archaeon]
MQSRVDNEFLEQLIEELKKKSMSLPSQLERIIRVNPQIETFAVKVTLELQHDKECKKIVAALFQLMRLNEVIDEQYDFSDFVKDVNLLLKILFPNRKAIDKDTLLQVADLYLKLFLDSAVISYSSFIRLVNEKGKGLDDNVVKALLVREEILDTFLLLLSSFEDINRDIDLRFFVAVVRYRFLFSLYRMKRNIEQKKLDRWRKMKKGKEWLRIVGEEPPKIAEIELQPIHKIYEDIKAHYPVENGEDIFYDILFSELLSPIYDIMLKVVANAIEEKKKELTTYYEESATVHSQLKAKERLQKDDFSGPRMNLEIILDSTFRITGQLTERNKASIRHTLDIILRRRMIQLYGQLYIPDMSRLLDVAFDEVYRLLLSQPYLALSVLSYEEINDFMEDPKSYVMSRRDILWELFKRKFRAYLGGSISYFTISDALVKIIDESLKKYNRLVHRR